MEGAVPLFYTLIFGWEGRPARRQRA